MKAETRYMCDIESRLSNHLSCLPVSKTVNKTGCVFDGVCVRLMHSGRGKPCHEKTNVDKAKCEWSISNLLQWSATGSRMDMFMSVILKSSRKNKIYAGL